MQQGEDNKTRALWSGLSEAPASVWEVEEVGSRKPKGSRGVRAQRAKRGAGAPAPGVGLGGLPREVGQTAAAIQVCGLEDS